MGPDERSTDAAAGPGPRRLCHYNLALLRGGPVRRMLELSGHQLTYRRPDRAEGVVVWGQTAHAQRGAAAALRHGLPLWRIEDPFLRSLRPGRAGDAPIGMILDDLGGVHFDAGQPSRLEQLLLRDPLDHSPTLERARAAMARIRRLHLSKYNLHDPGLAPPPAGYVLVVDQVLGDASVRASGADLQTFRQMLARARADHPHAPILVRVHPETRLGLRPGHFGPGDLDAGMTLYDAPVSPWALLEGAIAVYTVSSQLGFEAILAGHRPIVQGTPIYAGWGLTEDSQVFSRRGRSLTRAQLFAGVMILGTLWHDRFGNRLCSLEEAIDQLEAEVRAWREDRQGYVAVGMRLWKRGRLAAFLGAHRPLRFAPNAQAAARIAARDGRNCLVWGAPAETGPGNWTRVEDGFLRSRGLGAALVPALSLVCDDLGIYYDPGRPCRLEELILTPVDAGQRLRAEALVRRVIAARLSKYNLGAQALPPKGAGLRILVPGQVEDDASIRLGTGAVRDNLALLRAVRADHPEAVLIYKPHPDVEAGLRPGAVSAAALAEIGAELAGGVDPIAAIEACDQVATMTSLIGFEALLRGKPVITYGAPFYAGWGLTRDRGSPPERRQRAADGHPLPRPDLLQLAHAALIAYPRYFDPVTRRPCPPEVVVTRLAEGRDLPQPRWLRPLAKLQGALASQAWIWRR